MLFQDQSGSTAGSGLEDEGKNRARKLQHSPRGRAWGLRPGWWQWSQTHDRIVLEVKGQNLLANKRDVKMGQGEK